MTDKLSKIGTDFLDTLTEEIKQRTQTITCGELCDCYDRFSDKLKDLRSTSANFTGLGELVIFRLILSYLESYYNSKFDHQVCTTALKSFKLQGNDLIIGQCLPIGHGKTAKRPDITIWEGEGKELLRAIELKIYLTDGLPELKSTIQRMMEWHEIYPKFKGLILIFWKSPETKRKSGISEEIAQNKLNSDWLKIEILSENKEKPFSQIAKELCAGLRIQ